MEEEVIERWLPTHLANFEVSNLGRVRNIKTDHILKGWSRQGYIVVSLSVGNYKSESHLVHRLVMRAFMGSSPLTVNHKNLNRADNRLSNLEYLTQRENVQHAANLGVYKRKAHGWHTKPWAYPRGHEVPSSKLLFEQVLEIKERYAKGGISQRALGAQYGVSCNTIKQITLNRTWQLPQREIKA